MFLRYFPSFCYQKYKVYIISDEGAVGRVRLLLLVRHRQGRRVTRPAVSLRGGSNTGPGRRRKSSLLDVLHRRFVIVNPGEDEFISQLFTF